MEKEIRFVVTTGMDEIVYERARREREEERDRERKREYNKDKN
jgi:hypothetical protein